MTPVEAVIFDLDGTLVDSLGGIAAALGEALAAEGAPAVETHRVRAFVGDGPRSLCARALGLDDPQDPAVERLLQRFRARYREEPIRGTVPYAGLPEVLDRLAPRPLAVCTNKGRRIAEPVLAHFGFLPRLRAWLAEDDLPWRKPDPRPLLHLARILQVDPPRILMVGDGLQDLHAARAAGMPICVLTGGYTDPALLRAERPDLEAASVAELVDRLVGAGAA